MNDPFFLADDGARLRLRIRPADAADAEPVVMLHSLFFDGSMFDDACTRLSNDYVVYAPDHRGQGESESAGVVPSIARLASDAIFLIENEIRKPVHLVGSSMGGYVAMQVAVRRPDLLRSSAWSCCTAHAEKQPERFAALEADIRAQGTGQLGDTLVRTMFGRRFIELGDERYHYWRARFESRGPQVADAVHEVFARASFEDELARVRSPLLLFSGDLDLAKRPADMSFIAERVAGSRHIVIEHAGHTPPVETPDLFAKELMRFWRNIAITDQP
jgi:3-oxoadipate enol-lactonase